MNRFVFSLLLTISAILPVTAQQDSVIIKGKVLNLNGRLYREAPGITFSRNNILAPSNELSVNAALQPDGSFRTSLPLAAASEEIYLDYGGKVFTTFLAKSGEVEITFDADSMFKASKLFSFKGINAGANNLYPYYLEQETRLFESNKTLGSNFQQTFRNQGLAPAKQSLLQRANLRQRALAYLLNEGRQSAELTEWVNSLIEDESATFLMEYSLDNFNELSGGDDMDVKRFATSPLTYQKVLRANRFREYALRNATVKTPAARRNSGSLPVDRIATLVRRYVSPLSQSEQDKLKLIIEKKNVDKQELDFLSGVYKRGGEKLATIANFERSASLLKDAYDGPALEFLVAASFVEDFYQYTLPEKRDLYAHIKGGMYNQSLKLSLDELYRMEVKDSSAIKEVLKAPLSKAPAEVAPGVWMAESTQNGRSWIEAILKLYQGRTVYVINWDIYNDLSRDDMESAGFLRRQVPDNVVFLYLHVADPERPQSIDRELNEEERRLWKQYVVRHKLAGTHLFLDADQVMQLGLRTPGIPGTYYIIRPDGRYHSRNAPSPRKVREAEEAISAAGRK